MLSLQMGFFGIPGPSTDFNIYLKIIGGLRHSDLWSHYIVQKLPLLRLGPKLQIIKEPMVRASHFWCGGNEGMWGFCKVCRPRKILTTAQKNSALLRKCWISHKLIWSKGQKTVLSGLRLRSYRQLIDQAYLQWGKIQSSCDVQKYSLHSSKDKMPENIFTWEKILTSFHGQEMRWSAHTMGKRRVPVSAEGPAELHQEEIQRSLYVHILQCNLHARA